ncbi:perosamine synthetase-related protein [Candidatus Pacearchaeota archaeon]|nr:perosamine synthetase-related protein [Candidatus Pacearchaeota archaeon]
MVYPNRRTFLDNGRTAFSYILKQIGNNNKILLPSYIGITDKEGSGVFDPVLENGIDYDFYNVNKDLSIDTQDFLEKIKDPEIKSVLVIHYFGFAQNDIDQLATICKEHDKYLIEDCAHSLLSKFNNKGLGSFGDASFFSLHKILPMEGGGILQINNPNIKDPEITDTGHIRLFLKFDLSKIAETRRANYLYLLEKLKLLKGIEILYPGLPENIVPLNFPILIKNKDRNEVYFEMLDREIELVSLYYRLINQINESYSNSYYISKHIINLPIHQAITFSDIDEVVEELRKIIQK